jgi:hypothetical protein
MKILAMMRVFRGAEILSPALDAINMIIGTVKSSIYRYPYWIAPLLEYMDNTMIESNIEHQQPRVHQEILSLRKT